MVIGDEPVIDMTGDVLSKVTWLPLVTEETWVMVLPAASTALILKVMRPLVSSVVIV